MRVGISTTLGIRVFIVRSRENLTKFGYTYTSEQQGRNASQTNLDKSWTTGLTAHRMERLGRIPSLSWPVDGAVVQLQIPRHPAPDGDVCVRHVAVWLCHWLVVEDLVPVIEDN